MPWPARVFRREGSFSPTGSLAVQVPPEIAGTFLPRLRLRTDLQVVAGGQSPRILFWRDEELSGEAYRLDITTARAEIRAVSTEGWLRGGETLLQLFAAGSIPCLEIEDRPRFVWRGAMLDPARHFLPVATVKRFLESMAAVKLNVLHWHLTDDQGFRVESRVYPRLHQIGGDGSFYSQTEIREVVAHAASLGIRVVPEFDVPGHTGSWIAAYPWLGSQPGDESGESNRYEPIRKWGPSGRALDPTRPEVFAFVEKLFEEMAALFPDSCFHIGGDEVLAVDWTSNPRIAGWMREHGMARTRDLQVHFNQRLANLLFTLGKRMVGWDEILHEDLPESAIVQSWRGQKYLAEAVRQHEGVLSSGYYLDQLLPASWHYHVDPHDLADTNEEEGARVLGGEACLWGEYIGPDNLELRAWPRLAAVAERLWSPAKTRDIDDMYRRLGAVDDHLAHMGAQHRQLHRAGQERLAGPAAAALGVLSEVLEPIKFYDRAIARMDSAHTPLTRLVDVVVPESDVARRFSSMVAGFIENTATGSHEIRTLLQRWRDHRETLASVIASSDKLREIETVSLNLARVSQAGLDAFDRIGRSATSDERWWLRSVSVLERAKAPSADLVLVILPAVRQLVDRARRP